MTDNPIFTKQYWNRPKPRDKGDASADLIALSVGHALSNWERADQELAQLFLILAGPLTDPTSHTAVRRAYGAIGSNTGRRDAVRAAAEVYFGHYWDVKVVRQSLIDVLNAVQWASTGRDDIAHGVIWGNIKVNDQEYGAFHMPPEYNTGRTHAFIRDEDVLSFMRVKYRYTAEDIMMLSRKFVELRNGILQYYISIIKEGGRIPLIEDLMRGAVTGSGGDVSPAIETP